MNKIVINLGRIRKMVSHLKDQPDETEITFEFLLTFLFPSVWKNIQKEMRDQYTKGYLQGREERQK